VQFQAIYPPGETSFLCDENQIQQALVALFVNAVEAMPEGGNLRVEIQFDEKNDMVLMKIQDTGIGIPEEDVLRVFEPFFSTKRNGQGVGLGLSVVYGIVDRHGGRISVESKVGKGTTFTLGFPRSGRGADSVPPQASIPPPGISSSHERGTL
jgi:two-component system NtrC family sensor kinase